MGANQSALSAGRSSAQMGAGSMRRSLLRQGARVTPVRQRLLWTRTIPLRQIRVPDPHRLTDALKIASTSHPAISLRSSHFRARTSSTQHASFRGLQSHTARRVLLAALISIPTPSPICLPDSAQLDGPTQLVIRLRRQLLASHRSPKRILSPRQRHLLLKTKLAPHGQLSLP